MTDVLDKKTIRAAALALRDATSDEDVVALMRRLSELGPKLAQAHDAKVVSAFASIGREPAIAPMMASLNGLGFTVVLPVTGKIGTPLMFRRWTPEVHLVAGRMGIMEPPPQAEVLEPDLLFVPLAAFDRRGHRIGYGAGFYDRTLARLRAAKPIVAIGVAYACQEVLFIPNGEHDQPLDMVLTEKELILPPDAD